MYAAKTAGGGIRVFEDELRREMLDRVALGRELRDALARGGELAFQRPMHLPTGALRHVEALARWNHPTRGPVPPRVVAEASGLMPLLGRRAWRTACAPGGTLEAAGFDVLVGVNVSAQQLVDGSIVTDVRETLRRTGSAPSHLILELSSRMSRPGASPRPAQRLRDVPARCPRRSSCWAETFTQTRTSRPSRLQAAAWAHAVRSTHLPRNGMSPEASATGMKTPGGTGRARVVPARERLDVA